MQLFFLKYPTIPPTNVFPFIFAKLVQFSIVPAAIEPTNPPTFSLVELIVTSLTQYCKLPNKYPANPPVFSPRTVYFS